MKNRKAVWVQNGTLVVYPHPPMAAWELWFAATAQHQEKISYCIANLGKEQIPKFKVRFLLNVYYFCTRVKSNDSKSGTICIQPDNGITEPSQKVIAIIQVKNHGSLVSERNRHLK